ncbi:DUF6850 family outer membrane beta-barrel protein [Carboxylicivirga sp. N1Y90]|uniref:DUF6850 family outer membrane beta-barrel protein n=1 Tax=Carboxylicivirga fragile TaxID=3417571 RepID=UPI003D339591|nr:hypothetical protein [Marinilabiliaceae bacterium N1Y90]
MPFSLLSQSVVKVADLQFSKQVVDSVWLSNPAMQDGLYHSSFYDLQLKLNRWKHSKLNNPIHGNKSNTWQLNIESYNIKNNTTLFSKVYYKKGNTENVQWNNVDLIEEIGPYWVADTTKGTNEFEHYFFNGGIAHRFEKLTLAIEGSFLAKILYKTVNPRVKNISNSIRIVPGIKYNTSRYSSGFSIGFESYKQDSDTRIYDDSGRKDFFYMLEGLGYYDYKLSQTASSYGIYYAMQKWSANMQIRPIVKGIYANILFQQSINEMGMSDIIPNIYRFENIHFKAGWQNKTDNSEFRLGLKGEHRKGNGKERVYETVIIEPNTDLTDKRLLTESDNYSKKTDVLTLEAMLSSKRQVKVKYILKAFYQMGQYNEDYLDVSVLKYNFNKWQVKSYIQYHLNDSFIEFVASYLNYNTTNASLKGLPDTKVSSDLILPYFQFISAAYSQYQFEFKYNYQLRNSSTICLALKYENANSTQINNQQTSIHLAYIF